LILVACFILWKESSVLLNFCIRYSILDLSKPFKNKLALNILIHSFYSASLSVMAEIIASYISLYRIYLFCWLVCLRFSTSQNDCILVVLSTCLTCTDFYTESSISLHRLLSFIFDSCSVFNVLSFVESLINFTSISKYLFFRTSRSVFTTSLMWAYMSFLYIVFSISEVTYSRFLVVASRSFLCLLITSLNLLSSISRIYFWLFNFSISCYDLND